MIVSNILELGGEKMKKTICLIIMLLLIVSVIPNVYAEDSGISEIKKTMEEVQGYKSDDANSNVSKVINNVIGLIQFVGTGIAIVIVSILGIKYILASPNEKADVKKMAIPIIIGCILLFGAVNIVAAIYSFSNVIE